MHRVNKERKKREDDKQNTLFRKHSYIGMNDTIYFKVQRKITEE